MLSGLMGPRRLRVPRKRFLDGAGEVPCAEARLGPAGPPQVNRSVGPAHLRVAADKRDEVARVVGVQVRQKDLVELIDRQLQTGIVRQRAAPEVENQQVALGVADLDEDAGRGLGRASPKDCRFPAPSLANSPSSSSSSPGINISAYCRRGAPTTGVRVIAFVPPAYTGTGRDVALLSALAFSRHPAAIIAAPPTTRRSFRRVVGLGLVIAMTPSLLHAAKRGSVDHYSNCHARPSIEIPQTVKPHRCLRG
jgi:hypothetical protein